VLQCSKEPETVFTPVPPQFHILSSCTDFGATDDGKDARFDCTRALHPSSPTSSIKMSFHEHCEPNPLLFDQNDGVDGLPEVLNQAMPSPTSQSVQAIPLRVIQPEALEGATYEKRYYYIHFTNLGNI
jgi:hypothetical protein